MCCQQDSICYEKRTLYEKQPIYRLPSRKTRIATDQRVSDTLRTVQPHIDPMLIARLSKYGVPDGEYFNAARSVENSACAQCSPISSIASSLSDQYPFVEPLDRQREPRARIEVYSASLLLILKASDVCRIRSHGTTSASACMFRLGSHGHSRS